MIDYILKHYEIFLAGTVCGGTGMAVLMCAMFVFWINYTAIPLDECVE